MSSKFSDFQSLLQLSVGTNLTFAVILSLFDETFIREKKIIKSMRQGIDIVKTGEKENYENELQNIETRMIQTSNWIENLNHDWMRPILLICSLLALYSLTISSNYPDSQISYYHTLVSYGTLFPFIIFCVVVIFRGYTITRAVRRLNSKLDKNI
jgi:hypothetical protein